MTMQGNPVGPPPPAPGVNSVDESLANQPPSDLGPDMFYMDLPRGQEVTQLNEPLPRSTEGGFIEAVKRSVVEGLRKAVNNGSSVLGGSEQTFHISIEFPTDVTKYPGIWVQFNVEKLQRAGLDHGVWTKDANNVWGEIQEWIFDGRVTLSVAATSSKDRDRISDMIIVQLAFARSQDLSLRNTSADAQQMRALISSIENNPYVSMTLNTDVITSGGQTVTNGVPWAENLLLYEDTYSITCQGQFNLRFNFDGVYELAEIQPVPTVMSPNVPYDPIQWRGQPPRF